MIEFSEDSGWRPQSTLVARHAEGWDCFTIEDPEAVLRGEF